MTIPSPMEATMSKTIVVGVDGREGGRDALSLAGRLARMSGADLIALRVLPFDYYSTRAPSPSFAEVADEDARAELAEEPRGLARMRMSASRATPLRRAPCTASPRSSTPD